MKLIVVKYITGGLLIADLALCIIGILALEKGTGLYNGAMILIITLMVIALAVAGIWGKCPHCGKRLLNKLFQWKTCPVCKKPLV